MINYESGNTVTFGVREPAAAFFAQRFVATLFCYNNFQNSFPFFRHLPIYKRLGITLLRTLLRFFAWAKNASRLFSFNSALFGKNTGGRGPQCTLIGPPRKSNLRVEVAQKSAKPFHCHTSEKRAHNSFACHTSKIVEPKVLYLPHIRENRGGGAGVLLTDFR
jgi:hypothetical protein